MFKNAALPLFAATFLLTGCFGEVESPDVSSVDPVEVERSSDEATATPVAVRPSLPEIFDCLRENNGTAIAAHRGVVFWRFLRTALVVVRWKCIYDSRLGELAGNRLPE